VGRADLHAANTSPSWRAAGLADDDGTPVDVTPVSPASAAGPGAENTREMPPLPRTDPSLDAPIEPPVARSAGRPGGSIHSMDSHFVAGEVEVHSRPGEPEPEDEASFTAVSVLLSNMNDDTDGAGNSEPG